MSKRLDEIIVLCNHKAKQRKRILDFLDTVVKELSSVTSIPFKIGEITLQQDIDDGDNIVTVDVQMLSIKHEFVLLVSSYAASGIFLCCILDQTPSSHLTNKNLQLDLSMNAKEIASYLSVFVSPVDIAKSKLGMAPFDKH